MEEYVGIVCGQCDAFNPMRASQCMRCEALLEDPEPTYEHSDAESYEQDTEPTVEWPEGGAFTEEDMMDQQRNFVCEECFSPIPPASRFCGVCGSQSPDIVWKQQTDFFGSMQIPGRARLILIRGDQGVEGLSFLLQGEDHFAGRQDAQILFPEDVWLSPRHANFFAKDGRLSVRDEGSANGVFVRVRGTVPLQLGDTFLCGEQMFRVDAAPEDTSGPSPDQTYFYSSPRRPSAFRVTQVLIGGARGMVHCARDTSIVIGREESDMNYALDVFMSGQHARVEMTGPNQFQLTDLNSRNGTFLRIRDERPLEHGDYLFLGRQLLRVEMTA